MKNIAILGVHSAAGAELLAHMLTTVDDARVFVLDELGDPTLEEDVVNFLHKKGVGEDRALVWQRLRPAQHLLGMSVREREDLLGSTLTVFVAPHRPVYGMSLDQIRCVATSAIRYLSDLLKGRDAEVNYLSSYLIAGSRMGAYTEYDTDCGQRARNAYEYAALAGETAARALFPKERLKVFRLPFLSGSECDGRVFDAGSDWSIIERDLRQSEGVVFAYPEAVVPVAPVDLVSRHVFAIATAPDSSGTYHIAHCGLSVEALCRQLGMPQAKYRNLVAHRLRSLMRGGGVSSASEATACISAFSAANYLYPQVHHDTYRYDRAAERLGLSAIRGNRSVRTESVRSDEQQARYHAALLAYSVVETVGDLSHDKTWERKAVVDDMVLPYLDVGNGVPIVFLAGALGPEYWYGTLRYLMDRHRCILHGAVGWSATLPNSGEYADHETQAAVLKGLLAHLDLRGACHFVATDVSATVMQYFASRWPEKIASLQLVNPMTSPQELARCITSSGRSCLENEKDTNKLIAELQKSDPELRRMSAFDVFVADPQRRTPERWRSLRDNIGADRARIRLFCAALKERMSPNDLPKLSTMKCKVRVLWSCDNPIGDLSLYARVGPDRERRDIVLIADAGMDLAEAQSALVGDLIADYISTFEESAGVTHASRPDAALDSGTPMKSVPEELHTPAVERFRLAVLG
jgi:pimeloyl-ACP methyl ester carboxylesterase